AGKLFFPCSQGGLRLPPPCSGGKGATVCHILGIAIATTPPGGASDLAPRIAGGGATRLASRGFIGGNYFLSGSINSMKLAILSCSPKCYSTRRLRDTALQRGHEVRVLSTLKFSMDLEQGEPELYYRSKILSHYDAVLPRIGASVTYFGTAVVRQFEQMDVVCANSSSGIVNSRDKLRSLQILSRHHIGIPETTFVRDRKDILPAIDRIGGAPVIIKLIEGTQGVGVILAESVKVAEAISEALHSTKQHVLVQKFVAESRGRDSRALVVGDRVVAAMRRVAQGQEFRSNVHRGGATEPVVLDEEYAETAVRATQIMGLRIAGVDMLEGADGP